MTEDEHYAARGIMDVKYDETYPTKELMKAATSYVAEGKLQNAKETFEKALEIQLEKLGEHHPLLGITHYNIGHVLAAQGYQKEGMKNFEKSLEIKIKHLGENHPGTVQIYMQMGQTEFNLTNFQRAEELFRKAIVVLLESGSDEKGYLAAFYHQLAVSLRVQQKLKEAIKMFKKSLALKLEVYGEDHLQVVESYIYIGSLLTHSNKLDQADSMLQKALEIESRVEDSFPRLVAKAIGFQGEVAFARGNYEKATKYYKDNLDMLLQQLGEMNPETAIAYFHVSMCHLYTGRLQDALSSSAKGLKIRRRLLGDDNPLTQEHMQFHKKLLEQLVRGRIPG